VKDIGTTYFRYLRIELGRSKKRTCRNLYVSRLKKRPGIVIRTAIKFLVERPRVIGTYKHILESVDLALLANPAFQNRLTYEQDNVTVLENLFTTVDSTMQKKIIDQYISHILLCAQYGFFETKFNFLENNGVDTAGKIVLHDFNEVTLDIEIAKALVDCERWQYAYSFRCLTEEMKAYLVSCMRDRLTIETLETNWAIAV